MKIKYIDYQNTSLFLEAVARECLSNLTEEDKQLLANENNHLTHHLGLGMYIRNNFIYPQKKLESAEKSAEIFDLVAHADDYSSKIIKIMISLLKE